MGKVYKYGDNVDTDVIIPARYLNIADPAELAAHAMEDIDADFAKTVKKGDIIVAGKNFGSGSSREHAPLVLKQAGVKAVIAPSFARIFYRNAFNIGLPILESEEAAAKISAGDDVTVNFKTGAITNNTKKEKYKAEPFPEFMSKLISSGGLVGYVKGGK
ncbi:MAG: 3-isopropylmalate dehydratase small subunit [Clostridiales Family XIII bacterium]|nr:3-isopropylmalate dehydratase small subunit [Clostridiales Family XIII bacterium]